LLDALEVAGKDIHVFSATLRYVKTFAIQGDTQTRDGRLIFVSRSEDMGGVGGEPTRRFGITFTRLIIGDRIEDASTGFEEHYIFDGQWLAEIYPREHQFIRRQVVRPGEDWDPLRIGQGPFPIPIQQKKADILAQFDAKLLPSTDGLDARNLIQIAKACYQLELTTRADVDARDLRQVRIWYDKKTLLPRIARTITRADDQAFVLLSDLKTNSEVVFEASSLSTEPPADQAGWNITQEPWQE